MKDGIETIHRVEFGVRWPGTRLASREQTAELNADIERFVGERLSELLGAAFSGQITHTHRGRKLTPRFTEIYDHDARPGEVERRMIEEMEALEKEEALC